MRVVIDTNVLVSGIFWSGPPHTLLSVWASGAFVLCASAAVLEEYFEVIDRLAARCGRDDLARRWKTYLFEHAEILDSSYEYGGCRDPDDAKFVECAVSADAEYLASGDQDLLTLERVGDVVILSPAKLLAILDR